MKKLNYRRILILVPAIILLATGSAVLYGLASTSGQSFFVQFHSKQSLSKQVPAKQLSSKQRHKMADRVAAPEGPDWLPNDWMDRQRSYPQGRIKTESYLEAMRYAHELHASASRSTVGWEFAGPLNIGGRITDIEMPEGSNSTIFVGSAAGGIFKTINNGDSWVNVFQDAATLTIGDIALDPNNPDVIWAGTGEANASSQSVRGDGIYKSTDGGTNWQNSGLEESAYFGRIIVDHANSNRVFAAVCGNLFTPDANRGIYRTTNGGTSWQRVLFVNDSTSAIDIVQHPDNPNILYASMWERMRGLNYRRSFGPGSGIWKSTDGGDSWTELTVGLPLGYDIGRIGLAISPSSPDILYAFYDNLNEVAVYKTQNSGQSWTRTNDAPLQGINSNFGWYFGQIRVSPDNPDMVYVLGVDLQFTTDGGNSWTQLAGYFNNDMIHVDHHAMYINPSTGRVLEGNDGGLYFSDDYGYFWNKINNLPLTQFYDIEVDNLNPAKIYGGTQDNNSIRTLTGNLNDWEPILGGDGFYSLVDYTNSNIVYAEYQYGCLNKSTNGGSYMYPIHYDWSTDRVNWSAPVIMHPMNPETLYFGTYRVWKSIDGGNSWTPVSNDLTKGDDGSSFHTITTLAISSIDADIVLAGTDDGRVHISTTGGSLWTDISTGLPDRWITRVATDPFDVNTIYATCSGFRWDEPLPHVYRSTDLGQSWEPISSNLPEIPVNAFIADPSRQGRLFVGTDAGVFWSNDAGVQWQSLNSGLGNITVTSMKIHGGENFLLIGTYGLGAYKLDLAQLSIGVKEIMAPQGSLSVASAYPQPFNPDGGTLLNFCIASGKAASVSINITDLSGKQVFSDYNNRLEKGLNLYTWNGQSNHGSRFKPGIYLLQATSGNLKCSFKFLVI